MDSNLKMSFSDEKPILIVLSKDSIETINPKVQSISGQDSKPQEDEIVQQNQLKQINHEEDCDDTSVDAEKTKMEEAQVKVSLDLFDHESRIIVSDYICFICGNVYLNPVIDECGHIFCNECITQYLAANYNRCPINTNTLIKSVSNFDFVSKILEKQSLKCIYSQVGCEWSGKFLNLFRHLRKSCHFFMITCPHKGCKEMKTKEEMKLHKNECSQRIVRCDYCGEKVISASLSNHEDQCDLFAFNCDCGATLLRKELKQHYLISCPLEEVECAYSSAGCIFKIQRKDLEKHYANEQANHSLLFFSKFKDFESNMNNRSISVSEEIKGIYSKIDILMSKRQRESFKFSTAGKFLPMNASEKDKSGNEVTLTLKENESFVKDKTRRSSAKFREIASSSECSMIEIKSNELAKNSILDAHLPKEIKITGKNRVLSTLENNEHKPILTRIELNTLDTLTWKVRLLCGNGWVGAGVCIRELVQDNLKFIVRTQDETYINIAFFAVSSNGWVWNTSNPKQNNLDMGFKLNTGDVIKLTYTRSKQTLKIEGINNNLNVMLSKVSPLISGQCLVPCAILMNKGDEIQFEF